MGSTAFINNDDTKVSFQPVNTDEITYKLMDLYIKIDQSASSEEEHKNIIVDILDLLNGGVEIKQEEYISQWR